MTNSRHYAAIAICTILLSAAGSEAALAKTCSAAKPAGTSEYWSWREIDGRKCWYEGKPGLSKSLLEWSTPSAARREAAPKRVKHEPPRVTVEAKATPPSTVLNAQANAVQDPDSFDARWQARIGGQP